MSPVHDCVDGFAVRSQMTSKSLPSTKETMSSAKALRYPGVSLGVSEGRSSTTKFHRKGDKMPPDLKNFTSLFIKNQEQQGIV